VLLPCNPYAASDAHRLDRVAGGGPRTLWMMGSARAPQLVIFDCDGVLVDSESISNGVLAHMLSEQGLPTTLEQARGEYQGLLLSEVLERAEHRLGRKLPEGWLATYEREREALFRRDLRAVPGAARTVEAVRAAGVGVCVASQGKLSKTRLSLELTGMRVLGYAADSDESALRDAGAEILDSLEQVVAEIGL
jgi:beta-phosphoglucomutase-like phosphatase (HAD superfamily)